MVGRGRRWRNTVARHSQINANSPGTQYVPGSSFVFLAMVIGGIILAPLGLEMALKQIMDSSPELKQAELETDHSSEE